MCAYIFAAAAVCVCVCVCVCECASCIARYGKIKFRLYKTYD